MIGDNVCGKPKQDKSQYVSNLHNMSAHQVKRIYAYLLILSTVQIEVFCIEDAKNTQGIRRHRFQPPQTHKKTFTVRLDDMAFAW